MFNSWRDVIRASERQRLACRIAWSYMIRFVSPRCPHIPPDTRSTYPFSLSFLICKLAACLVIPSFAPIACCPAHKNPPRFAKLDKAARTLNCRLVNLSSPIALDGTTANRLGGGGSLSFKLGFLGRLNPDISSQDTGFP
jgi:hypothetical protein